MLGGQTIKLRQILSCGRASEQLSEKFGWLFLPSPHARVQGFSRALAIFVFVFASPHTTPGAGKCNCLNPWVQVTPTCLPYLPRRPAVFLLFLLDRLALSATRHFEQGRLALSSMSKRSRSSANERKALKRRLVDTFDQAAAATAEVMEEEEEEELPADSGDAEAEVEAPAAALPDDVCTIVQELTKSTLSLGEPVTREQHKLRKLARQLADLCKHGEEGGTQHATREGAPAHHIPKLHRSCATMNVSQRTLWTPWLAREPSRRWRRCST